MVHRAESLAEAMANRATRFRNCLSAEICSQRHLFPRFYVLRFLARRLQILHRQPDAFLSDDIRISIVVPVRDRLRAVRQNVQSRCSRYFGGNSIS